jgi:DNA-binding Lrp family transcriptional regulator
LSTKLRQFGVEMSTVGVLKRVERLKEKGVIKHFTVKTDPEKLGLTTPILILIRLRPKPIKDFVKDIKCDELQDPRVLSLHTLAHQYNLAVFGIWESKEEYGKWKTRLLTRLDSVLETNELFVLDSYKEADDTNIRIPAHIEEELEQKGQRELK